MVAWKQAVGEDMPAERDRRLGKKREESAASGVVGERLDARERVTGHVMDEAGSLDSRAAWHVESLGQEGVALVALLAMSGSGTVRCLTPVTHGETTRVAKPRNARWGQAPCGASPHH